jgi:hypothetical protein
VLQNSRDESAIDFAKSQLPQGTQVIRLRLGSDEKAPVLLALRRNPQARLHELGVEGDGNWAFEKAESFSIRLWEPAWLSASYPFVAAAAIGEKKEATQTLSGTLDPVKPSIFVLQAVEPPHLNLLVASNIEKLKLLKLSVSAGADAAPGLFAIRVLGPDHIERAHYGGLLLSKDGALEHKIFFALNDPSGSWTVSVRNLLNGASATALVEVKEAE